MKKWDERPIEIANLLNPAFCGEVLRRCIKKYEKIAERPFPYPLVFLILPIVLHKRTRESIQSTTREQLHVWLQSHQDVRIDFSLRTRELIPIVKETILFLLSVKGLSINRDGGLSIPKYRPESLSEDEGAEITDCYRKAEIVGRWFARAGTPTTIYTMWGVRP